MHVCVYALAVMMNSALGIIFFSALIHWISVASFSAYLGMESTTTHTGIDLYISKYL